MIVITTIDALPGYCYECPCHDGESGYCQADKEQRCSNYRPYWCPLKEIRELLKEQPEQKHGHWFYDPDGMDWGLPAWRCSECRCRNDNIPPNLERMNPLRWSGSKYCPNCGAKMDEEVKQDG